MNRAGKVCVLCGQGQEKTTVGVYGKLHSKAGITAHYFCLLFSSGLCQNGASEREGILGFLPADITKEVTRGVRLKCSYCKSKGATIGCVKKNCKANFHLGCGRKKDSFHQFYGSFCSYCSEHRPQQDVPAETDPNTLCSICTNTVKAAPCNESLRAPCCSKYWYHRECIQQYAMSAGIYFFKCPMCKNKEDFQQELLTYGIYIPEQDASWETEPNAFQELLERYQNCDAQDCKCVEGRKYDKEGSKWEIFLCAICGSQGSHEACKFLTKHKGKHVCPDCSKVVKCKSKKSKSPQKTSCVKLDTKTDPLVEYTKESSSEYPGPSHMIQKTSVPPKFNSASFPKMNQSSKTEKGKKSVKKNTEKLTGIKDKKKDGKATFMDRYLNKSLSLSPSSSSSAESASEDSILMSYLNNNKLMSAYDLKETKKYQKKAVKYVQRNKSDKICQDTIKECKKKMGLKQISPLSAESVSNEKDKTQQKTLHSWFKGPITPKKNNHLKEQAIDNSIKPSLATSPRKRKKKPYVVESHGFQYLIRSPKVHLGKRIKLPKHTLKLNIRKSNLVIDMVDDRVNPGWENELAILSSIDTEVRVTRNMVSTNRLENFIPIKPATFQHKKSRKSMVDELNKMDLNISDLNPDCDAGSHTSSSIPLGHLLELSEPESFDKTKSSSLIVPSCSCNSRLTNHESTHTSKICPLCTNKLSGTNEGHKRVSFPSSLSVLEMCNTDCMKAKHLNEQSPSLINTEENMFTFKLSGIGSLSKDVINAGINRTCNIDQDSTDLKKCSVKSSKSQMLIDPALSDNSVWTRPVFKNAGVNSTNLVKINGFLKKNPGSNQANIESIAQSSPCKRRKLIVEEQIDFSPKDVAKSSKVYTLSKNKRSSNDENADMKQVSYRKDDKDLSTCRDIGTPLQKENRDGTVETVSSAGSNIEKLTNYKFEFEKQKASLKKRSISLKQDSTSTQSNAEVEAQHEGSFKGTSKSVPVDSPSRHTRKQSSQVQNCDRSESHLYFTSLANSSSNDEGSVQETRSCIQVKNEGASQNLGSPKITDRVAQEDSPSRHTRNSPLCSQKSIDARKNIPVLLDINPANLNDNNTTMKTQNNSMKNLLQDVASQKLVSPKITDRVAQEDSPSRYTRNSPLRLQKSVDARKNIPVLLDINQAKLNNNNTNMKTQNYLIKSLLQDVDNGYCDKMDGEMKNCEQMQAINEKPTTAIVKENLLPQVSSNEDKHVNTKDVQGKESTSAVNKTVLFGPENPLPPPSPFSSDRSAMSAYYVKD